MDTRAALRTSVLASLRSLSPWERPRRSRKARHPPGCPKRLPGRRRLRPPTAPTRHRSSNGLVTQQDQLPRLRAGRRRQEHRLSPPLHLLQLATLSRQGCHLQQATVHSQVCFDHRKVTGSPRCICCASALCQGFADVIHSCRPECRCPSHSALPGANCRHPHATAPGAPRCPPAHSALFPRRRRLLGFFSCPPPSSSPVQVPPQPGQVLLGYEVYKPAPGCCQCEGLSAGGLIAGGYRTDTRTPRQLSRLLLSGRPWYSWHLLGSAAHGPVKHHRYASMPAGTAQPSVLKHAAVPYGSCHAALQSSSGRWPGSPLW